MKERPIIFNSEMVRAVLSGNKTQTRRIVNPQLEFNKGSGFSWNGALYGAGSDERETNRNFAHVKCPHGKPGDRLWVRETWAEAGASAPDLKLYRAKYPDHVPSHYENVPPDEEIRWRPSIHMPRWASRITLEITGVRFEQLASISNDDARAEGYPAERAGDGGSVDPWLRFRELWEGIYPEHSFKHNPWVWIIEFGAREMQS